VSVPERGALQVLTTDALVEGIHFDRRFSSLGDVGYKALAVNVSDVAAMGGTASLALLSLMLPDSTAVADVDALLDGFLDLSTGLRVSLAGGNITRSPGPLIVDVTVIGYARPRRVLTRGNGRPGEALYVTGAIGAAAAGLAWLKSAAAGTGFPDPADGAGSRAAECVERYRRPVPRARIGAVLGRTRAASACMDLSDGLADAVTQLAAASGTGARIEAGALPIHEGARAWFTSRGADPIAASLAGGDDYELLFAVPTRFRGRVKIVKAQARGVPITRIGELTAEPAVALDRDGRLDPLPSGFVHF
jgi:thiamine-monophosphate kinase